MIFQFIVIDNKIIIASPALAITIVIRETLPSNNCNFKRNRLDAFVITEINSSFYRTIGIIAPMAKLDIAVADEAVMRWVNANPFFTVIEFNPGMGFSRTESESRNIATRHLVNTQK